MSTKEARSGIGRRLFLQAWSSVGFLWPLSTSGNAIATASPQADPLETLAPWLDTLIPHDETPSATELGVDRSILSLARKQAALLKLLDAGCRWLEDEARRRGAEHFAALPEPAREEIARAAKATPGRALPRVFFDDTWALAISYYYARRDTWASLGYHGPPQPIGFPDADQAP